MNRTKQTRSSVWRRLSAFGTPEVPGRRGICMLCARDMLRARDHRGFATRLPGGVQLLGGGLSGELGGRVRGVT